MDDSTDGTWMSHHELAQARGISRASAARLVHRHRWSRRTDNDGKVRVFVPHGQDVPADRHPTDVRVVRAPDDAGAVATLRETFAAALAAKDALIGSLRDQLELTKTMLGDRTAAVASLELRFADAEQQVEALEAQWREAQDALRAGEKLKGEIAARQARGRLRRAWDGWRGH